MLAGAFDEEEQHEHYRPDGEAEHGGAGRPPLLAPADDAEGDAEGCQRERDDAQMVDAGRDAGVIGQYGRGERHGDQADRHSPIEDPLPGQELRQDSTGDIPDACGGTGDRAPHGEGHAFVAPGVRQPDERQQRREHRGAGQALYCARGDQHRDVGCQPTAEGGEGEDAQAGQVEAFATQVVAE